MTSYFAIIIFKFILQIQQRFAMLKSHLSLSVKIMSFQIEFSINLMDIIFNHFIKDLSNIIIFTLVM